MRGIRGFEYKEHEHFQQGEVSAKSKQSKWGYRNWAVENVSYVYYLKNAIIQGEEGEEDNEKRKQQQKKENCSKFQEKSM